MRLLNSVTYPADMSQLLVCINMAGQSKLDSIAMSQKCMAVFVGWTQVQCSLLTCLQSACATEIVCSTCLSHAAGCFVHLRAGRLNMYVQLPWYFVALMQQPVVLGTCLCRCLRGRSLQMRQQSEP